MNAAELAILIRARDEASRTVKDMAGSMQRDFDETGKSAGGLGSALGKVGEIASGFLAANVIQGGVQKLTGFLNDSVQAAKESAEVNAQLEAVLKSTGGAAGVTADQARDLSTSLEHLTNFDDETVLSAEDLLLTFTNIGKDAFPQVTAMALDMSQALGQDVKSSAIQLGKALNDPIQGMTALKRVGVSFNEEQIAMVKHMQESGDLAGAQALIMAELTKEFGGSAAAAVAADGGITQMKNAMQDQQELIGAKLIPILAKLTQFKLFLVTLIVARVIPALETLYGWGAKVGGVLKDKFLPPIQQAASIAQSFGDYLLYAAQTGDAFSGYLDAAPGPLIAVWMEMGHLAASAHDLIQHLEEAKHFFELGFGGGQAGGDLGKIQQAAFDFGKTLRDDFLPPLREARDKVEEFWHFFTLGAEGGQVGGELSTIAALAFDIGQKFTEAKDKIAEALDVAKGKAEEFLGGNKREVFEAIGLAFAYMGSAVVVGGIIALGSALLGAAVGLLAFVAPFILIPLAISAVALGILELIKHWDDITKKFPVLGVIADAVKVQLGKFTDWITASFIPNMRELGDKFIAAGEAIVTWVNAHWDTIRIVIEGVMAVVALYLYTTWEEIKLVVEAAFKSLEGLLDIFTGIFTGNWGLAWDGVKEIASAGWELIKGLFELHKRILGEIWDAIGDKVIGAAKAMMSGALNAIDSLWNDEVKPWFLGLPNNIVSAIGDVGSKLWDVGVSIVQGLINGVKSMIGEVTGAVGGVIDAIPDVAKKLLHINSPSLVMAGIGRSIAEGLSVGMTDGMHQITLPKVTGLVQAIPAAAGRGIAAARGSGAAGGAGGGLTLNLSVTAPLGTPAQVAAAVLDALVHLERRGGLPPGTTRGLAT